MRPEGIVILSAIAVQVYTASDLPSVTVILGCSPSASQGSGPDIV
jgi:hypothetical protein